MIEYSTAQEAADAMHGMNGSSIGDRDLTVPLLDKNLSPQPTPGDSLEVETTSG